ncbi:hypothetical protein LC048_11420 [Mesobacillus subterraneus]|uniref:hypothetical protein n=1 Tax=Mesobacillus subterraneus TaxID=285983 RepID=UPI001CFE54C1|nr:hypothetical protein [Mesobacillus subterraneus]WLR57403.1 hypothetical protein LC048_11420 [Mesobacillus subterraneus]
MKQILALSSLLLFCIFLVYNSPQISQRYFDTESLETNARVGTTDDILETILPEFEYVHERDKDKEVDGYIVETHREYEIQRDEDGNIIKQMPTLNFEYIRYKKY